MEEFSAPVPAPAWKPSENTAHVVTVQNLVKERLQKSQEQLAEARAEMKAVFQGTGESATVAAAYHVIDSTVWYPMSGVWGLFGTFACCGVAIPFDVGHSFSVLSYYCD